MPNHAASSLVLGFDLGSSFLKGALLDLDTGHVVASVSHPEREMAIQSPQPGWAEQEPRLWWEGLVLVTRRLLEGVDPARVGAIGLSYQMHGLVCVGLHDEVLRPAILWCDGRAAGLGREAFDALGHEACLGRMLNSPGNFTASKLAWVKEHEPETFRRTRHVLLPGDYLALRLTGAVSTTVPGLSEGMFWDFQEERISRLVLEHYGLDEALLPPVVPTFGVQGVLSREAARELGLPAGIPLAYRAGDQPNNAFSLGVLEPGQAAATAGTSGVVYGVSDRAQADPASRVNLFAHVNHTPEHPRLGALLCLNGAGILYAWMRRQVGEGLDYDTLNALAASVPPGAEGLRCYPFGNGAERMLGDCYMGATLEGLDFNRHRREHLLRAALEGVAFSFLHGMNILRGMGQELKSLRAGRGNLFLSPVFRETLAGLSGAAIGLYDTDGAVGAARGAAFGAGLVPTLAAAQRGLRLVLEVPPQVAPGMEATHAAWRKGLDRMLESRRNEGALP